MNYPSYLNKVPKEIINVKGKYYWKFDYESEEAKQLNLNIIQKLLYPLSVMNLDEFLKCAAEYKQLHVVEYLEQISKKK